MTSVIRSTLGSVACIENASVKDGGTLVESVRNIAPIPALRDNKGCLCLGSIREIWEPVFTISDVVFLSFSLLPSGSSFLPLFGGFNPLSFIVIPRTNVKC